MEFFPLRDTSENIAVLRDSETLTDCNSVPVSPSVDLCCSIGCRKYFPFRVFTPQQLRRNDNSSSRNFWPETGRDKNTKMWTSTNAHWIQMCFARAPGFPFVGCPHGSRSEKIQAETAGFFFMNFVIIPLVGRAEKVLCQAIKVITPGKFFVLLIN